MFSATAFKLKSTINFINFQCWIHDRNTKVSIATFLKGGILLFVVNFIRDLHLLFGKESGETKEPNHSIWIRTVHAVQLRNPLGG